MKHSNAIEAHTQILGNNLKKQGYFSIDWGRQGGVILGYILAFLGYYGIIANTYTFDQYGRWISFTVMNKKFLIWTYITYIQSYFLPAIFLFLVCFVLTYKEDIPQYGIKASLWLVPFIVVQGFIFYFIMYGLSFEPFIFQFAYGEGYLNILILYGIVISGSLSSMKFKQYRIKKRQSYYVE